MATTSSPTVTTTVNPLQIFTTRISYYGPFLILSVGVVGCICSFITFTAPQLRKNSCAFYFLMTTVFELLSITFGLLSSFAGNLFGSNMTSISAVYCKVRAFLVYSIPLVATYLVLLASIDRCMSSSIHANFRSFSQVKVAYRATLAAMAISLLSCIYILVAYDLRPRCSTVPGSFAMFDSMFVVFWLGIIPHVLMLLFGSLTFANIRRSKRQIWTQPQTNSITASQHQRRNQKTDAQLIFMMLAQVGLSSMFVLTFVISYAIYTLRPPVTPEDRLLFYAVVTVTNLLFYANYAKSFYLYTLSSNLFRSIFVQRIRFLSRKILGQRVPAVLERSKTNNAELTAGSHAQPAGQLK